MALPARVTLTEVGPREGFQFEGIGHPDRIPTADKLALIRRLAKTGVATIQAVSFVSPAQVPQMADAEAVAAGLPHMPGVAFTGIYLNDRGLERALAAKRIAVSGSITLTASEAFSLRNQKRTAAEDLAMAHRLAAIYGAHGIPVAHGMVMAAFGCNFEGRIALGRVLDRVTQLQEVAGGGLKTVNLADTMGWADPEQLRRTVDAVRSHWPDVQVALHLHDTRGLAVANAYAALLEGVDQFDSAVGGLGGCPFAGHTGAAGNVCTEEMVFLCRQLGIETGIELETMVETARYAQTIVGHALPSRLLNASLDLVKK